MTTVQVRRATGLDDVVARVNDLIDVQAGHRGGRLVLDGYSGDVVNIRNGQVESSGNFTVYVRNEAGNHYAARHSTNGTNVMTVTDGGLAVQTANVSGSLGVVGQITGQSTVQGTQLISTVATGTAPFQVASTTKVANLNADLLDGLDSTAFLTQFNADPIYVNVTGDTMTGPLTVQGNATLGTTSANAVALNGTTTANAPVTANAAVTVKDTLTVQNSGGTVFPLFVDPSNTRVIVGSTSALPSSANDRFVVSGGRAFFAPNSEEAAIVVRYGTGAVGSYFIGATNSATPSLKFKDTGAATMVTMGAFGSSYQLDVTGNANVSNDLNVAAASTANRMVAGGTTFSSTEKHRVIGTSRLEGAVTVTTGGIGVTGSSVFNSGLSVLGGLTVTTGGAAVTGASTFSTNVTLSAGVLSAPGVSVTANGISITGGLNIDSGGGNLLLATNVFTANATPRTLAGHALLNLNGLSRYVALYL